MKCSTCSRDHLSPMAGAYMKDTVTGRVWICDACVEQTAAFLPVFVTIPANNDADDDGN